MGQEEEESRLPFPLNLINSFYEDHDGLRRDRFLGGDVIEGDSGVKVPSGCRKHVGG